MLKMQIIGHIGNDAVMHQHGTDNVLNFSCAHTDKYKDGNGQLIQKTTWVSCSWWVDGRSTVGQYLKKGTLVYIEGVPEAKMWENRDGKKSCGLSLRVIKLELLGGKREDNNQQQQPSQQATQGSVDSPFGGYVPAAGVDDGTEPPF